MSRGDYGLHYVNITGIILLIIGITGTVIYFRSYYPKIRSRVILGSIAFLVLFPIATEKLMYLIQYNDTGEASFTYQLSPKECRIDKNEENLAQATCEFTYYNYGQATKILLKPVLPTKELGIEFQPTMLSVTPHSQGKAGISFYGDLNPSLETRSPRYLEIELEIADIE